MGYSPIQLTFTCNIGDGKWAAVSCSLSRRLCVLGDLGPAHLLLRFDEKVMALTLCCCVPTLSTSPASRLPCAQGFGFAAVLLAQA